MKLLPTIIAILSILGLTGGGIFLLKKYMPVAAKEGREKVIVGVEVQEAKAGDIDLTIFSQGLVAPVVETVVTSEVAGQVIKVAPNFEVGGSFKKGDVLLELDDTDYQAAKAQAEAEEKVARLELELELSRQVQAERDWKELGGDREQSDLAKRIPQVAASEARLEAATMAVAKAKKDLERTKLVAKYDGRVRSAGPEIGAYVTPGARLAELYGTEHYEVRLPVSLNDFAFVDVLAPGEVVTLETKVAGEMQNWKAKILRTEGQIDRASRSVFLVVGLKAGEGFSREDVLAPNLFVKAEIQGRTLKNVVRVPRIAFADTDKLLVLNNENQLQFRRVKVIHEGQKYLYVKGGVDEEGVGINDGEKFCVTALAAVVDKMEVRVTNGGDEAETAEEQEAGGGQDGSADVEGAP